jgi:hypothetical protein
MISILKSTKRRVNAFAQFIDDEGTRHLTVPHGMLEWVGPPAPPADFDGENYDVQEVSESPYVVYTKKSAEQLAQLAQAKINAESLAYLASTDWYAIRFAESGVQIPEEVQKLRQAARDAIVHHAEKRRI